MTTVLFLAAVPPEERKESASGNYQLQGTPNTRNGTFVVPSVKNTALIFPKIFFIQYFTIFSCTPNDVITELICIIEKCQYL